MAGIDLAPQENQNRAMSITSSVNRRFTAARQVNVASRCPSGGNSLRWGGPPPGTATAPAAQEPDLAAKIGEITHRPIFRQATFGIRIATLEGDSTVYELNADRLFIPGSTAKLVTVGTALELLGGDFRFLTPIHRTGKVSPAGTLEGDLVLVASGDPNLSQRLVADSLIFPGPDHSYGVGSPTELMPGDPLGVLRSLAKQVRGSGIRRIQGRVRIDAALFRAGDRELGTNAVISPFVLNDNIIDIVIRPAARVGAPAEIVAVPATRYLHIVSEMVTGPPDSTSTGGIALDTSNADGSRTLVFRGRKRLGGRPGVVTYQVLDPTRFGEIALEEVLGDEGIVIGHRRYPQSGPPYQATSQVAAHRSAPFGEAAKVTLKVSQNLHASLIPYFLAGHVRHDPDPQAGFDLIRTQLLSLGLDPEGSVQSDGAGGAVLYTPRFLSAFLVAMARTRSAGAFLRGLPVLGRDGTLTFTLPRSEAAGHVFAKTGTSLSSDQLNRGQIVNGKGLAGYLDTKSERRLVFAAFVNNVKLGAGDDLGLVGDALAEIAGLAREMVR